MIQKSYDKSATLYLIPTPIGNMDDITYRAVKLLEEVDFILAEDTRVAHELLNHFNINKKVISNYEYNEEKNYELILKELKEGKNIGLISDRGTPAISDPGSKIASYIISQGFNVVALPGATALIPALTASGLDTSHFTFYGFLNNKESKRKKELLDLKSVNMTLIFYESPHRIMSTLGNIYEVFGDRQVSISREISKKYEEIYRGTLGKIIGELETIKGEFVIVVAGNTEEINYDTLKVNDHIKYFLNQGYELKEAMKVVAKTRNIPKSAIYKEYHKQGSDL